MGTNFWKTRSSLSLSGWWPKDASPCASSTESGLLCEKAAKLTRVCLLGRFDNMLKWGGTNVVVVVLVEQAKLLVAFLKFLRWELQSKTVREKMHAIRDANKKIEQLHVASKCVSREGGGCYI